MLIIRPCQLADLEDLMALSKAVGRGMTSMPADREAWLKKIEATERAFSKQGKKDPMSTYF
ncbi:MAG: arginine N-succinyltransferase, partial [Oceanospirillum sp.]|nr:arginine N-succinyltransferase [Oceanospirillum sp.]